MTQATERTRKSGDDRKPPKSTHSSTATTKAIGSLVIVTCSVVYMHLHNHISLDIKVQHLHHLAPL